MYNTDLYNEELDKINNLEVFKTTKKALMSIYSYFIKLGATTEKGLRISFEDMFDRYKRWHIFAKTKANFVKLSYKLVDLGLLTIEKIGNKNIYFARKNDTENLNESTDKNNENLDENLDENIFIENGVKEEVKEGVKVKKPRVHSIDTEIEEGTQDTQILNTKTNYYYIITDTESDNNLSSSKELNKVLNKEVKLSNYEKAIIKNNKEKLNSARAFGLGVEILSEKNIKTEKIKARVLKKLNKLDNVIVKANARAYIETMIENACAWYEKRRIAYATKVKYNNKSSNKTYGDPFGNGIKAYDLSKMTHEEILKIFD